MSTGRFLFWVGAKLLSGLIPGFQPFPISFIGENGLTHIQLEFAFFYHILGGEDHGVVAQAFFHEGEGILVGRGKPDIVAYLHGHIRSQDVIDEGMGFLNVSGPLGIAACCCWIQANNCGEFKSTVKPTI